MGLRPGWEPGSSPPCHPLTGQRRGDCQWWGEALAGAESSARGHGGHQSLRQEDRWREFSVDWPKGAGKARRGAEMSTRGHSWPPRSPVEEGPPGRG